MPAEPLTLLAEDDDNDVYFFQRALEQAQIVHPLRRVTDGEEAIEYLRGEGKYANRDEFPLPTVLLLDLKMPRRNGFEVIEWVRSQPLLRRLPIVVLSSSRADPDVARAYDLGANTYLVKPVKFDHLVELVRLLDSYWLKLAERPNLSK
jgi:CheY-like chemotaxis protein